MRYMRRLLPVLLALSLVLSGCVREQPSPQTPSPAPSSAPGPTAEELVCAMLAACPEEGELIPAGELPDLLEGFYSLSPDRWEDAAILQAGGASAFELAAVRLAEGVDVEDARQGLQAYLTARQGDFTGYAPGQAALCAEGMVMTHGQYVALAITEDTDGAFLAFAGSFSDNYAESWGGGSVISPSSPESHDRYPFTAPNVDDMTVYDADPILKAWETGDRSTLSTKDAAILEAAEGVLDEMLSDGMSDYEKETALYLWLTYHVDYDWAHQSNRKKMDPDSPNPYGALTNRRAICLGFATTFQLFMDLAGVECITVVGAAFQSSEDHAWNMVRLNGEWYCVDPTWDIGTVWFDFKTAAVIDPMDAWEKGNFEPRWSYFNVTSDRMAESDHQWDYDTVPEATATDGGQLQ